MYLRPLMILVLVSSPLVTSQAATTVHLDFDGHTDPSYPDGSGTISITVPAFSGSATEKDEIQARLEEDFAPFDITLTRNPPAGIDQGFGSVDHRLRIVIGGSHQDIGNRTGLSTNPYARNTVWSTEYHSDGTPRSLRDIATTAAHEAGHAFGHAAVAARPEWPTQSYVAHYIAKLNANDPNPLAQESHYLLGQGKTEIMNGPRGNVRDIWWRDVRVAKSLRPRPAGADPLQWESDPNNWIWSSQDDIRSITGAVGARATDDHPDAPQNGTPMTPFSGQLPQFATRVTGTGLVEMNGISWPGLCPPVPQWFPCDCPAPTPGSAVAETCEGQSVVLALQRDFFRFDVTNITQPLPDRRARLELRVDTLDASVAGPRPGNLDADLELWFDNSVGTWSSSWANTTPSWQGWIQVTACGRRLDATGDVWAGWSAEGTGNNSVLVPGSYAVAVKSAGGYGDLGQYQLQANGVDGVVVAATRFGARPPLGLDPEAVIAAIEGLELAVELTPLLARLAEFGVAGPEQKSKSGTPPASKLALKLIEAAIRQSSPLHLVSSLIAWEGLDKYQQAATYQRLREALERIGVLSGKDLRG